MVTIMLAGSNKKHMIEWLWAALDALKENPRLY